MSAQLEDGYTRIANEILEQIAKIKLSPTQYRLLFIVWRYTYGFNRKEHDLTLGFLSKATGCDKRQLQRELKGLEERNIVHQKIINGVGRKIQFNKKHDKWIGKTTIGETTIGEIDNGESDEGSIGETDNPTIGEIDNQERKIKENIKDIINIVPFDEIIVYLNQKAGTKFKHNTVNTKKHINARWNEGYRLIDFQRVVDKKCAEWIGSDMERFLCPDTLFGTKFEKYLNQKILLKGGQTGERTRSGYNGRSADELDALSL
jgi:phage replication O-like protein O